MSTTATLSSSTQSIKRTGTKNNVSTSNTSSSANLLIIAIFFSSIFLLLVHFIVLNNESLGPKRPNIFVRYTERTYTSSIKDQTTLLSTGDTNILTTRNLDTRESGNGDLSIKNIEIVNTVPTINPVSVIAASVSPSSAPIEIPSASSSAKPQSVSPLPTLPPYNVNFGSDWGTPSTIIKSPTLDERIAARRRLLEQCSLPYAYDGQYWFTNRPSSVLSQHAMRDSLNTEAAWHISRYAARTIQDLQPCKRTVVSIATIPSRINKLYNLISSIRAQTVPPDAILIALPPFAPRLKQTYEVPDFLKNDPLVKLVDLPVDYGPLSKLAAAIVAENDPNTCIITYVYINFTTWKCVLVYMYQLLFFLFLYPVWMTIIHPCHH